MMLPALLFGLSALAEVQNQTEDVVRDRLCAGWQHEAPTGSGGRIDCLSEKVAIEVDFSEKWAEAIGQALHYAAETELWPGIILICRSREETCLAHGLRLESTLAYWSVEAVVWWCDLSAKTLRQCQLRPTA